MPAVSIMAKRFQTYFGVPIPPFKEKKLGAGSVTIRFVIVGSIPAKKNHQQAVAVRKKAYEYMKAHFASNKTMTPAQVTKAVRLVHGKVRPNTEYMAFLATQKPVIHAQMEWWSDRLRDSKGLIFPLSKASLSLRFYFKSRHVQDTVNKQQSVQDLLKDCGVIVDDDYDTINPIHSASACYVEEIIDNIAFISLSFRL
jgi:hypothetical protein